LEDCEFKVSLGYRVRPFLKNNNNNNNNKINYNKVKTILKIIVKSHWCS
jgi:hypothetical protein